MERETVITKYVPKGEEIPNGWSFNVYSSRFSSSKLVSVYKRDVAAGTLDIIRVVNSEEVRLVEVRPSPLDAIQQTPLKIRS